MIDNINDDDPDSSEKNKTEMGRNSTYKNILTIYLMLYLHNHWRYNHKGGNNPIRLRSVSKFVVQTECRSRCHKCCKHHKHGIEIAKMDRSETVEDMISRMEIINYATYAKYRGKLNMGDSK